MKAPNILYHRRASTTSYITLFFLTILTFTGVAQKNQQIHYIGTEVTYGFHRFVQKSKNHLPSIFSNGVSMGVFAENQMVSARLRIGSYQMANSIDEKLQVTECDLFFNVHLLEFFRTHRNVLDIYLITGLSHNRFRLSAEESINSNFKLMPINNSANYQAMGLGVVCIPNKIKRLTSLFCELLVYNSISTSSLDDSNAFVNIGVNRILLSVGRRK